MMKFFLTMTVIGMATAALAQGPALTAKEQQGSRTILFLYPRPLEWQDFGRPPVERREYMVGCAIGGCH